MKPIQMKIVIEWRVVVGVHSVVPLDVIQVNKVSSIDCFGICGCYYGLVVCSTLALRMIKLVYVSMKRSQRVVYQNDFPFASMLGESLHGILLGLSL